MRPFASALVALPILASFNLACGPTVEDAKGESGSGGGSSGAQGAGGSSSGSSSHHHQQGGSVGPVTVSVAASSTSSSSDSAAATSTSSGASDMYPAPHPAAPQGITYGGPMMTAQKIVPVFFSNDDPTIKAQLKDFVSKIGPSEYWATIGGEYGVGPGTSLPPIELAEAAVSDTSDGQIQRWLTEKLQSDPTFPQPDDDTIYALFYPDGTSITLQGEKSCSYFGGYHNSTQTQEGQAVIYAVLPRCSLPGMDTLQSTTGSASHEFLEAATDPQPEVNPAYLEVDDAHFYWGLVLGGELADLCAQTPGAFQTFPGLPYMVQRTWSNQAAAASHDPCIPAVPGQVYFGAVPELNDTVPIDIGGGAPVVEMKGVNIEVGKTKTIEIDLFSDGPTNGPFDVQVIDSSQFSGDTGRLDLSLDKHSGVNGQKLQLTITPQQTGMYGFETFIIYTTQQGSNESSVWVGLVAQNQ